MHRVDTSTAAAALPTTNPAGTPGYFTQGDPVAGTPATVPGQDWFNMIQEELCGVVLAAGLALTKGVYTQLLLALQRLFFSTGDGKITLKVVADPGWVMANDGSIGNATSGATTRANNDTQALFILLWTNISNTWCPVQDSAGNPVARGATAAADFAANRRIVLPKVVGRALAIAGSGAGLSARALGQTLGEETHQLTQAETPLKNHTHAVTDPGHSHSVPITTIADSGTGNPPRMTPGTGTVTSTDVTGISIQAAGDATANAHNIMQPTTFFNAMIKL